MSSGKSGSRFARLSSKILLSMGGVLLLFALVIGFHYVIMLPQGSGTAKTSARGDLLAEQMKASLLEAQKYESLFRLDPDPVSVAKHQAAVTQLLSFTEKFTKTAREKNDRKSVATAEKIINSAQELDSEFLDLVQATETKGISNAFGLREKLADAGRELEKAIARNEAGTLALSLLRLQSFGKEYLRTNSTIELRNLRAEIKDFNRLLTDTAIEPVEAQVLRKGLREFNSALDRHQAVSLATGDRSLSATLSKEQVRQADAMRTAMDNLEDVINRINVPDALPMALIIRQHEAKYLLTGDGNDTRQVIEALETLTGSFNNSSILQKHKDEILAAASAYRDAFTALVDQDAEISEILARLNAISSSIETQIDTIVASGPGSGKPLPFAGSGNNMAMTGAIAGLAVILIGLLVAVFLGKSISAPIVSMSNIIRRITANKDFSVEIPVSSHYEIGVLARELNALLRLQERAHNQITIQSGLSEKFNQFSDIAHELRQEVEEIGGIRSRMSGSAAGQHELLDKINTALTRLSGAADTMNQMFQQSDEQNQLITDAVEHIGKSVETTVEGIKAITRSSSQFSDIVTLSAEITEQTSLLALNASVKAARAGSHGKEFAVIADEIANLAQRSEEVAREAGQLTLDLDAKVDEAIQLGDESKKSLDQVHEAGRLNLSTARELAIQTDHINSSAGELGDLVKDLAATANEIEAMADDQASGCAAALESVELLMETSSAIAGAAPEGDDSVDTTLKQAVNNIAVSLNNRDEGGTTEADRPDDAPTIPDESGEAEIDDHGNPLKK
ncbi:MAG: methyl-accepting chemotaxis protein [Desulfobulbaceae bacterium]|nr:methyl-accepting chemotaxis protein [Desulfobulbaceae bacterium]